LTIGKVGGYSARLNACMGILQLRFNFGELSAVAGYQTHINACTCELLAEA